MQGDDTKASTAELLEACSILFGGNVMLSVDFLRYVHSDGLRDAYRRRLMETHPDRARILGEPPEDLHHRLIAVKQSYNLLQSMLRDGRLCLPETALGQVPPFRYRAEANRPPAQARSGGTTRAARAGGTASTDDLYYTGPMPRRPLRIGEFLYYSGVISWQTLIRAICVQRRERPLLGELAIEADLLTPEETRVVRIEQHGGERFGETAVRLGLLTPRSVALLLGRQRLLGRPFGQYIARTGALSLTQIERLVEAHRRHNRLYRKR